MWTNECIIIHYRLGWSGNPWVLGGSIRGDWFHLGDSELPLSSGKLMQSLTGHRSFGFYFNWKAEEPLTGLEQGTNVVRFVFWRGHFINDLLSASTVMGNHGWKSREGKGRTMRDETLVIWLRSVSVATSLGPILESGCHHGNLCLTVSGFNKWCISCHPSRSVSMQIQMSSPANLLSPYIWRHFLILKLSWFLFMTELQCVRTSNN